MSPASVVLLLLGCSCVGAVGAVDWPFAYNESKFPAAWFGANATNWESPEQLMAIGRYSMAILGWQHLTMETDFTAVVYEQITQAAIIKSQHPDLPVFVYCGFGWAMGLNAGAQPILNDPDYKDFFLLADDGGYIYTQTDCQQGHTSPGATDGRCVGHFWNFHNASARDYFVDQLVAPLAQAGPIDGVFFDATNYGYDIPEVHPWNRMTVNVPNCTFPNRSDFSGCGVLVDGSLEVAARTTELLNAHGKVPMFANPGYFGRPMSPTQKIWLDEARLVQALEGMKWMTYYESARAETSLSSGALPNMLQESSVGVAAGVHTYYHNSTEDPLPHMAAFMLAKQPYWFYFGSTGWWDDSFAWTELYDRASGCGAALGPANRSSDGSGTVNFARVFEHCNVLLTCSDNGTTCTGDIAFEPASSSI